MFLACCSPIIHLNAKGFLSAGNNIENVNSATLTQYIGHSRDRVYLEFFSAITSTGHKTIVYWTEIDNLPDSIKTIILENKNPWVPLLVNSKKTSGKDIEHEDKK